MKLRIKGNSLRLRISQSEMARLLADSSIAETIQFGPAPDAHLTYVLKHAEGDAEIALEYAAQTVTVLLSSEAARAWAGSGQTGIYGEFPTGADAAVMLMVEKDFACLDGDDPQDADAFPNPSAAVC